MATVQFGIDLGTTNSAIARMTNRGAEIVPNRRETYLPSVVAVDKRGDIRVGREALNPQLRYARWFKRHMGTRTSTQLGDGSHWMPEQLSAEVLKALASAARLKTGEDLVDVVITVPAMFNQPQCAATYEAAKLAGLNAVALMQEPIAAAASYLFENPIEGSYLVYDLGGGTFDVSLVRLHDGEMNVVEHGGDNYLGGLEFDKAVFDWVLEQVDLHDGDVDQFEQGAPRLQLLEAIEEARLCLSEEENVTVYLDDFDLPIAKLHLNRPMLEDLVCDVVSRSIFLAKERLKGSTNLQAALLVGGPTQMPYIRTRLKRELGIPVLWDEDPMTVVARGAAIHASTIQVSTPHSIPAGTPNVAQVELFYEPVTPEPETTVSGKFVGLGGMSGHVRISSSAGDWETGLISLRNDAFVTEVSLGHHRLAEFKLELRDSSGRLMPTEPSTFTIRSGVRTAQPVAPYNYSVVLEGGENLGHVVRAGEPLPAVCIAEFRLAKGIVAGTSEGASVYIVEGNSELARDNVQVAHLVIRGTEISRSIREGEKVEVQIDLDNNRLAKALIYVPSLDEDFRIPFSSETLKPDARDLHASLEEANEILRKVDSYADTGEQEAVLEANRQIEKLESSLEDLDENSDDAVRIQKQLSDTKARLRPLERKYGVISSYDSVIWVIASSESMYREANDQMALARLSDLREEAERAKRLNQPSVLEKVEERALELYWPIYMSRPECWVEQIELLEERRPEATNQLDYSEHVHNARKAFAAFDFEACRISVLRAWQLIPRGGAAHARFQDAALRL